MTQAPSELKGQGQANAWITKFEKNLLSFNKM